MHKVVIPDWALERIMIRRGKPYAFDQLDPKRTALIVVDLQNGFMASGQPAEVPVAREIVDNVNALAAAVRIGGGLVVFTKHTLCRDGDRPGRYGVIILPLATGASALQIAGSPKVLIFNGIDQPQSMLCAHEGVSRKLRRTCDLS
jgi:nicotinamidase-related amidase